ncbi:MAG: FeoB-associated Cys-rich membrane protein [Ruminococcus sp.]|nr:FeoB-associated Cys-rich membrane protein [Ruminococcus sp.]
MLAWITNNIGTIIICAVLIAIVSAIIISMIKKKKQGKSLVCNCTNCKNCAMSGQCHKTK